MMSRYCCFFRESCRASQPNLSRDDASIEQNSLQGNTSTIITQTKFYRNKRSINSRDNGINSSIDFAGILVQHSSVRLIIHVNDQHVCLTDQVNKSNKFSSKLKRKSRVNNACRNFISSIECSRKILNQFFDQSFARN